MKYAFLALATILAISFSMRQARSMDVEPAVRPAQSLGQYWRLQDRVDRLERELAEARRDASPLGDGLASMTD
jgi:hypothetical protein